MGGWKVEGAADACGFTLALSAVVGSSFMIIDNAYLLFGNGYNIVPIVGKLMSQQGVYGWR